MKFNLCVGFGIAIKNKDYKLSEHPLFIISNVKNYENLVFVFNLSSAKHLKEGLNYITKYENSDKPRIFTAKFVNDKTYDMVLIRDCAILPKEQIFFENDKTKTQRNKLIIKGFYYCKNYKELKKELLSAISDNPFDIVMYDGLTGEILQESIYDDLLDEIDNLEFS